MGIHWSPICLAPEGRAWLLKHCIIHSPFIPPIYVIHPISLSPQPVGNLTQIDGSTDSLSNNQLDYFSISYCSDSWENPVRHQPQQSLSVYQLGLRKLFKIGPQAKLNHQRHFPRRLPDSSVETPTQVLITKPPHGYLLALVWRRPSSQ